MKKFLRPIFPAKSVVLTGKPIYAPPAKLYRVMFAVLVLFWLTAGVVLNCSAQSPTATIGAVYDRPSTTGDLHTGVAHIGDKIYVEIDNVSEAIQTPVVTIDGKIMNIIGSGTHYQADYNPDSNIQNGSITIVVNLTDLAGNTSQTTFIPSFTFDHTPTIIATGTLSALSTNTGTASATTQFSVSTFNISALGLSSVTVTAPPGFEVATTGSFGQSVIFRSNDYSPQLVYVRLAAADAGGAYSGDVVLSSPGATSVHVPTVVSSVNTDITSVSLGSANPSLSSSVVFQVNFSGNISGLNTGNFSLSGTAIQGAFVDYITGSGNAYQVHVQTGTGTGTLVLSMVNTTGVSSAVNALPYNSTAYNMDRIPPTATISAVYDRPFTTGDLHTGVAHTGDKVYVEIDNLSEAIQTPVVTIDGKIMNIIGAGTHYQADYNPDLNIQNGSITIVVNLTDLVGNTTQTTLNPSFTFDGTPTIIATGTLSALSTNTGTASATTQISVSTFNISTLNRSPVTVTAPPGFEVSTTGPFGQSVIIRADDYSPQLVYVRLAASDAGGVYSGDVVLSSSGATSVHVATAASSVATLITSIAARGGGISSSSSVTFDVAFKDNVSGLTAGNFSLTTSGVSGANISLVTGAGNSYTVAVNTGTGSGTITLNLANVTGISPAVGNAMPFIGDTYTIDKVPLTVSTTAATNITATSATLANNITPIGGAFVIDCGAVYSTTNTSPTLSDTKLSFGTNTFNTGTYSGTATGLSPNTTYYVTAYATNTLGTNYGSPVSFTTASANLSGIGLSAGTLNPGFSATTTGYTASVGSGVSSITITPTASYSNTVITVNGSALTGGSANVNLNPGPNTITILVTADGTVTNSYTLTVNRAYTPPGNALAFDGVDDGVIMGPPPTAVSGSFTVEAWVMPTDATKEMHIFSTRATGEQSFDIQIMNGNRIHGDIGSGSVWLTTGADATFNYKTGQWIHIAYVVTPTVYSIYANGNLVGTGTLSGTPLLMDNTHTTTIGCYPGESTYFNGSIDEVRVYNAALSPANIQADMVSSASSVPLSLVNYYDFDNGAAGGTNTGINTLTDRTATGYNGTLSNFALSGTTSNWVESYAMVVPTATAATSVGATGFTANWTAPATGTVTNYLVDVSASPTFASVISGSPFSTTSTSTPINGLTGGNTYYYRVRADKASVSGEGDYSGVISAFIDAAPVLAGTGTASYTQGGTAATVVAAITATDVDTKNLTSATVTISGGFLSGDLLGATTTGTAITATYNAGTGVLTLSGTDSVSNYQQVLQSVEYSSTSQNPTNFGADLSRTISFITNDGSLNSNIATATVNITVTTINSISVASPNPTNAASVNYTVTFAGNVTGLSAANFTVTATGGVSGASVTSVSGSGAVYTVSVNTGTGDGTLALNLDNATGLSPGVATALPFAGGVYTIDKTAPTITVGSPSVTQISSGGSGSVSYSVTYADANFNAGNLDDSGITLNSTGTATGLVSVSGSGTSYIVTISTITGVGTLGIAVAGGKARDIAGNTDPGAGPSATFNVLAGDANLASLTLSTGFVKHPDFAGNVYHYASFVGTAISTDMVTPTSTDPNAIITVNGSTVASGTASQPISLNFGANLVTVVVTARDGVTKQTYTDTLYRALSANSNLLKLITNRGLLSPGFSNTSLGYTVAVAYGISSITFTPTTVDVNAKVTVGNSPTASGAASVVQPLDFGDNRIEVVVTAQNGSSKTFVITVTRAKSNNDNLFTLTSNHGGLTPMSPGALSYTKSLNYGFTSVTFTPTTVEPHATITVGGSPTISGTASVVQPLNVGDNVIAIVVTAQDRIASKTYTVIVTRAAAPLNTVNEPVSVEKPLNESQISDDGVLVHQGISPNGDGINDFLLIDGIANYPDNKLQVMNRSGQLIFEAKNYDNSTKVFDGHSNKTGAMQLPGTYFYSLDYMVNGVAKHKTGFVVLKY